MTRRARVCAALLLLLPGGALLEGCVHNACEARPTEAQIDIVLREALPDAIETEVSLRVNDEAPLSRVFNYRGSLGFVFELGALDRPPRQLSVSVVVRDAGGTPLALGSLRTGFVPNGCNFFSVEAAPLLRDSGPADAGADAPDLHADAAPPDRAAPQDGPRDAAVDADTDAAVDATPDADTDAAVDAAVDATPDAAVDSGS